MINYTVTPASTVGHTRVFDNDGRACHIEAVEPEPDFAEIVDSLEDELKQSLESGADINFKDLAAHLVSKAQREMLGDILLRLLVLLSESENIQLDIEVLISAAGLKIREEADAAVAARFGVTRQVFSARKKTLLKKLNLTPPPHSKSLRACETYKHQNRRNGTIE